jgi:hypothetical protein
MRLVTDANCKQKGFTSKGFPNYDLYSARFARMNLVPNANEVDF